MNMQNFLQPKECVHCGSDPVFHRAEKWSLIMNSISRFALSPLDFLVGVVMLPFNVLVDKFMPATVKILHKLGVGRLNYQPDANDSLRTVCLWEEAEKRGIKMWQYRPVGNNKGLFVAEKNGKKIFFDTLPRPNKYSPALTWMDNKAEFKKRVGAGGFPVAKGGASYTFKNALKIFRSIEKPVVVKPHSGSATRHTALHIDNDEGLRQAFDIAKELSPLIVIEEELIGDVYRPTLVDGRLVGVLGRTPPHVVGDGQKTIKKLIDIENTNPKREGPFFHKIKFDNDVRSELAIQGLNFESIPETGKKIRLHQKINWSIGGTTYDITDKTHPDNQKLFEDIAEFLGDSIIGLDFIIGDIKKPWKEQKKCGFIECNGMPFIDNHHYPFEGRVRNVAGAVWDMVFYERK